MDSQCVLKDIVINLPAEEIGLLLNTLELLKLKELTGISDILTDSIQC